MASLPLDTDGAVIPGLIDHLSPSAISVFLRCPRKYWYRYVLKVRPAPDGGLVTGSAVHHAIEISLKHLMERGEVPHPLAVGEMAGQAVSLIAERDGCTEPDLTPFMAKATRVALAWRDKVAPGLRPLQVEVPWELKVGDVKVIGRFDLIEEGPRIRDWKTSGKTPVDDVAMRSVQTELYTLASKGMPITYTYIIDQAKGVKIVDRSVELGVKLDRMQALADETVHDVAGAVRAGYFPRNRDGWWCSQVWCEHFADCILNPKGHRP